METRDEDYYECPKCHARGEIEARYGFDDVVIRCKSCDRKFGIREINGGKRYSRGVVIEDDA